MKKNKDSDIKIYIIGIISVLIILGLMYLTYVKLVNVEQRGSFGDMFGSVNALFSGLAFGRYHLYYLATKKRATLSNR